MRCPDCAKMVSYGEPDTDDIEIDIDGGTITLSGELTLTCAECSSPLAVASLEAEEKIDDSPEWTHPCDEEAGELVEFDIIGTPEIEATERQNQIGRNVKRMKKYYGVEAEVVVRRSIHRANGNEDENRRQEATFTIAAEEQASSFEPC